MVVPFTLLHSVGPSALSVILTLVSGAAPEVDPVTGALFPVAAATVGGPQVAQRETQRETQPAPQDEALDPRSADRKRVLELADGTLLRNRTRFVDGAWQQRIGRDWLPVTGTVVGFTLESDLLSRARAMASEVGKSDHAARTVLADWMISKGLSREALGELNTVLAADPDHEGAHRLLRDREFALDLLAPGATIEAPSSIAIAGAQGSAAVREALVWTLARMRDRFDVQGFIEAEMTTMQFRRRAFAALAARRLARGPLQRQLTDRAVLDTMGIVREEAALGLRDFDDPLVVAPVVDALGSRFAAVRRNAAEALGNAGYAAAVAPLMAHLAHLRAAGGSASGVRANLFIGFQTAYVGDYDVEIAQGSSIADPVVSTQASGVAFDVRAQAQISRSVTLQLERREVVDALRKLTGERDPADDPGNDPEAWLRWWERHRVQFEAERVVPTLPAAAPTQPTQTPERD
ncbi:MAG: HEAT repeat domain-containing protein [Planctomycetota bacterium]